MGIASDLRQSVLQAAMQGKLTMQKAEDGDARDLLRAICEEKEKLVKEKKGKKEKPLAPIAEDEIPFDIPENWVWCRLGELGNYKKGPFGSALTKSKFVNKGINTIKIYEQKNVIKKNKNIGSYYITKEYFDAKMQGFEVHSGDILVSCAGTIGETYILPEDIEQGIINQALMRIRLSELVYAPYFLLYFDYVLKENAKADSNGSAIKNIPPFNILKKYAFALPPLPEQRRIVARIDALMKEIDELEQTEKELEAIKAAFPGDMKASLLQAAMEGKLTRQKAEDGDARDLLLAIREEKEKLVKEKKIKKEKPLAPITDEDIPFDIPENWVWCRLNDITVKEIRRGKSPKYSDVQSNTLSFAQKCNTKYDGIQMSLARYLDESTLKRYTEEDAVIDGDTIINSTGHGTLGRVGFFTDSDNPDHLTIYPDSHVTIVRPSKNCDSRFIHLYIKTQQSWFETKGEGSTNQTELKPAVIKSIVIPLPPLPEQQRIVEKLDQLLPLCDSLSEH